MGRVESYHDVSFVLWSLADVNSKNKKLRRDLTIGKIIHLSTDGNDLDCHCRTW